MFEHDESLRADLLPINFPADPPSVDEPCGSRIERERREREVRQRTRL